MCGVVISVEKRANFYINEKEIKSNRTRVRTRKRKVCNKKIVCRVSNCLVEKSTKGTIAYIFFIYIIKNKITEFYKSLCVGRFA